MSGVNKTPLNLIQYKQEPSIQTTYNYSGNSTGNVVAQSIFAALGLGLQAYSASKQAKAAAGGEQPAQKQETQAATQQAQISAAEQMLTEGESIEATLKSQVEDSNKEIKRLTNLTDPDKIKAKKEEVAQLHEQLYGNNSQIKNLANQITNAKGRYDNAQKTWENAVNTHSQLSGELSSLKTQKDNADALMNAPGVSEKDKTAATERSKELEGEISIKGQQVSKADQDKQQAENIKNQAFRELDTLRKQKGSSATEKLINDYNNAKAELNTMELGLESNKQLLQQEVEKFGKLEKAYKDRVSANNDARNKLIDMKGELQRDMGDAKTSYTENDKKDGNWFSRTWQKTKGIFSKKEREEYQVMKDAHAAKKEAKQELTSFGLDASDFKAKTTDWTAIETTRQERHENAEKQVNDFLKGREASDSLKSALQDAAFKGEDLESTDNTLTRKYQKQAENICRTELNTPNTGGLEAKKKIAERELQKTGNYTDNQIKAYLANMKE